MPVRQCMIISNGQIKNYDLLKKIIKTVNYIICADGGAEHLFKINITPNIIIGDLDSISKKCITYYKNKKVKFITFPKNKDKSDTQLAAEYAVTLKPLQIIFTGVTGTRLDHTLSNIFLLKKILDLNIPAKIVDENNEVFLLSKKMIIKGKTGDNLSIIPLSEVVQGITLKGLEYPLTNARIEMGSSHGISNKFTKNLILENTAEITIKSGLLLIIKSKD